MIANIMKYIHKNSFKLKKYLLIVECLTSDTVKYAKLFFYTNFLRNI